MEVATLTLSIIACFLSLCAFAGAAVTAVIVIGWKSSTHKIVQVAPTAYEYDVPPEILARAATDTDTPKTKTFSEPTPAPLSAWRPRNACP
jgi:hypothetical protein